MLAAYLFVDMDYNKYCRLLFIYAINKCRCCEIKYGAKLRPTHQTRCIIHTTHIQYITTTYMYTISFAGLPLFRQKKIGLFRTKLQTTYRTNAHLLIQNLLHMNFVACFSI